MTAVGAVSDLAPDPGASRSWWAVHTGKGADVRLEDGGLAWSELARAEIGYHPAEDVRNPVGDRPGVYGCVGASTPVVRRGSPRGAGSHASGSAFGSGAGGPVPKEIAAP